MAGLFSDTPPRRRAAEELVRGLKQAGIVPLLYDLAAKLGRPPVVAIPNGCLDAELAELAITDVIVVAPPERTRFATKLLPALLAGMPRLIAFWDGPLDEPEPMLQDAASELDAIWVPTADLAEIALAVLPDFAGEIDIIAPRRPAVPAASEDRDAARHRLGVPESAFVIGAELAVEDALDGQNPHGILGAFRSAFDDDLTSFLVVRCDGPELAGEAVAAFLRAAQHPRVRVVDTHRHYLPPASLLRAADAWLALPFDAADRPGVDDALGAGLQVVACARGLTAARRRHPALHPVRYTLRATVTGAQANWVMPDIAHAATLLRSLRMA